MTTPRLAKRPKYALAAGLVWLALLLLTAAGQSRAQPSQAVADSPRAETPAAPHLLAASPDRPLDSLVLGQGQPLVLLTGYAMTKEMWDTGFIEALARGHRLVLLDYRGMGETPLGQAADISLASMADDVVRTMGGLGIEKAHILGWSMGGMVAQEIALSRPEAVCSLTLLATAGDFAPVRPAADRLAAMGSEEILASMFPVVWSAAHPEAAGRVRPRVRPLAREAVSRQYAAMLGWPGLAGRLGEAPPPVLILTGSDDWVCPPRLAQALWDNYAAVPGASVNIAVLAHGSHWMMHQFPDVLAAAVEAFLARHPCPDAQRKKP
ncbi:MAG: putative hydrolase or acyltransferase of alpha/beta superfamily [Solidesulfovibrio magneticus str. Maddingley MBC34]|uniref:Putative hydrolase or acyltransferase of alpha/beta superfamily n=1 Tax=Solidesulfovibrio magneticus str. Maddingley MBC34 TaxID=1206767 RepID=K6FKW4_9BACT|nr:MAG: putative hydrolase or acyltransferase of alpha/beta superfamily [Solidesulfovibrio magneticus str. Maddingley MBC34]